MENENLTHTNEPKKKTKTKPNRKRDKSILLRTTEVERDTIISLAETAELSVNDFILQRALDNKKIKVVKKENSAEVLEELRRITQLLQVNTKNMNQIATYINTHKDMDESHVDITHRNLDKATEEYRKALAEILSMKKEWS